MNVLFITNFPVKFPHLSGYLPLGILYLSGALRRAGHRTAVCSTSISEIRGTMRVFKPDIVAYSVCTGGIGDYLELNRLLKREFRIYSVFGGPHPTYFPEMIEEEGVDAVCRGEGEDAIVELADALRRGEAPTGLRNWWIKKDGKIHKNPVRPLSADLDSIPFPDRDLFFGKYPHMAASPKKTFIASRGCAFDCPYCYNRKFRELYKGCGTMRRRSPAALVDEVVAVTSRYPTQFVLFVDDTFNSDAAWVGEFSRLYARKSGMPFACNVRVDLLTEGIVRDLRAAGCRLVMFGIESGNEELRRRVLKRNISDEQIVAASRLLKANGIRFITFNMVGLPEEGPSDCYKAIRLNHACGTAYPYTSIFQPYPGTEIADTMAAADQRRVSDSRYKNIPFSLQTTSVLRENYDYRLDNMQRLFSVFAALPDCERLFNFLVKLPLTHVYAALGKFWAVLCYRKLYRPKLTFSQYLSAARDLLFKYSI